MKNAYIGRYILTLIQCMGCWGFSGSPFEGFVGALYLNWAIVKSIHDTVPTLDYWGP